MQAPLRSPEAPSSSRSGNPECPVAAKKPTDPAEIARKVAEARRDPTKWGWNEEAFALPSAADVDA